MSDLVNRLNALTQELVQLNSDLEKETATLSSNHSSSLVQELGRLKTFKTVVDHTRHLLWPLVLGAEQHAEQNVARAIRAYRMERIMEMVAALQQDSDSHEATRLFFSELSRVTSMSRPN